MSLDQEFQTAQEHVQKLSARPSNETLLKLYALYKQAYVELVQQLQAAD